jgi:hypothetical protein
MLVSTQESHIGTARHGTISKDLKNGTPSFQIESARQDFKGLKNGTPSFGQFQ